MHVGEVAWYATGRFYKQGDSLFDVGYFLHLGDYGPMFNNHAPGESSAHFTFSTVPFTAKTAHNGLLDIALDPTGTFSIFFNEEPCATFDDPSSFAQGQCIATFERVSVVAGVSIKEFAFNVFTARLVWSAPFKHGDLRETIPYGVTQWGTAAGSSHAFVGSAILIAS